ncbi:MAG: hypothetical protein M1820_006579 [Bogoriella megaspora]|nr:MAG: hypothetical protein M1820_006579 [Bogoriella megaspora]
MVRPTIGVLSIGDMGVGIAKLLLANNYRVATSVSNRSEATKKRAQEANITLVNNDSDLAHQVDFFLSIVPPRDALATAQRIAAAKSALESRKTPLWYLDLNAIAPKTSRQIADVFNPFQHQITFLDGGIIGGPPSPKPDTPHEWKKPSVVISGPSKLADHPSGYGTDLASLLNIKHVADEIGPASGLKMCFASTTKGLTAIAIQSFTTASRLGVLEELREHLGVYSPKTGALAEAGVKGMPSKAHRWVEEMRQIGETFREDGGWEAEAGIFQGAAEVYRFVAGVEGVAGEKGLDVERVVDGLVGKLKRE